MCARLCCGFYALESEVFADLWRFQSAPARSVARSVQTSGVINLIKGLHADACSLCQETREWWQYFISPLPMGEIYEDVWAGSAQDPAPSEVSWDSSASSPTVALKNGRKYNSNISTMPRTLILADLPGLELICVLSVSQVPGARTRVRRRAVWLPGKERQVNTQRSQEVLPTDHVCAGLLPQSFHLVSRNTHVQSFGAKSAVQQLHQTSQTQDELLTKLVYMQRWTQIMYEDTISFYSGVSEVLEYFPSFEPVI